MGSEFDVLISRLSSSVQTQGLVSSQLLPSSVATATPIIPTGTAATSYNSAGLSALWSQVETTLTVSRAQQTTVVSAPSNFTVPKTPILPNSLKDNSYPSYKAPKGFLWGVASAAQQYEGAVKDDGRGPSSWDWLCHRSPSSCTNYTSDSTSSRGCAHDAFHVLT